MRHSICGTYLLPLRMVIFRDKAIFSHWIGWIPAIIDIAQEYCSYRRAISTHRFIDSASELNLEEQSMVETLECMRNRDSGILI